MTSSLVTVDHCDIIRNYGSGIYVHLAYPTIHSIISAFNSGYGINYLAGSLADVTYCDASENNGGNFHGLPDPTGGGTNFQADPLFVDLEEADFHLLPDSPCRGTGRDGTSVGIFQYPDIVPPQAVLNLAISGATSTSVILHWIATGDDSIFGRAAAYDLRYSTTLITTANFNEAIQVLDVPEPSGFGIYEVHEVTGLVPNQLYYFALKVIDDAGNISEMSNVVNIITPVVGDITPPAAITNLTVIDATYNSVTLQWTAPGDDGMAGRASLYDCRYSMGQINAGNFLEANLAVGEPQPAFGGVTQVFIVYGLDPNTLYYFALRTRDETNWSGISNVVSATTDPFQPIIVIDPATYDFGNVMLGYQEIWNMSVCNDGALPLIIDNIISNDANYTVENMSFTLQPGQCQTVPVTFSPSVYGPDSGTISITNNDPDALIKNVTVTGTGIVVNYPVIAASPNPLDFGQIDVGQSLNRTLTIYNSGGAPLIIDSITSNLYTFTIVSDINYPLVVTGQGQESITVRFTAVALGLHEGYLAFESNDPVNETLIVDLIGYGYDQVPLILVPPVS
ncbi:MAG: choice-of-anchor D domain-containing protein, partial [Planctomycetes bacterium]|nr:choice-of-anchor D domain-containing protein [Planctomycetota bacterium]